MKRKLVLFAASLFMALDTTLTFTSPTTATTPGSCRSQCRVGYQKCVREASNPGALNHCGKAYQACLSGC